MELRGREISRIIIQVAPDGVGWKDAERYKVSNVEEMVHTFPEVQLDDQLVIKWLGHLVVKMMMNVPYVDAHGFRCEEIVIGCDRLGGSDLKHLLV